MTRDVVDALYRTESRRVFATLVRLLGDFDLADYLPAHAARADLCRQLGRSKDSRASYERALALTRQESERRFLERRIHELAG